MRLPAAPVLPLRTPRLVLRPFHADDCEALLAFHSDPEAVRYVPYAPRDRDAVATVLERKVTSTVLREEGDLLELAVVLAEEDELIGDLLLVLRSVEHETLEVGYIFSPAHAGQGYATEAVHALGDLSFHGLGARRMVARVDVRNAPSCALLERLGMRREATLVENEWIKGELTTEAGYAVLAREWSAHPPDGAPACYAAMPSGEALAAVLTVRGYPVDLDVLYREMHRHSSVDPSGARVFAGNAPGVPAMKRLLHTLFDVPVADRIHPVNNAVRSAVRDRLDELGWATKDSGRSGRYVLHREL